jgi:hypothetical protein
MNRPERGVQIVFPKRNKKKAKGRKIFFRKSRKNVIVQDQAPEFKGPPFFKKKNPFNFFFFLFFFLLLL